MPNYDEAQRLTPQELELQSTDTDNFPYIKQRGMLYWTGAAWAKWTGDITIAEFPTAAPITDNFANPTTTSVMGMNMIWDGSAWDRWTGAISGTVAVTGVATSANQILGKTMVRKTVDFTASQTGITIWDPTGGTKFVITDYDLSFSAAGAITVFDSTDSTANRVFKYNGADNGGAVHSYTLPHISATTDNILKYTTGAGAAGSLTIIGYEV